MSYVNNMRYVYNTRYLNNTSYVNKLDELYELCKLYEYFYELLKITWNHLIFAFRKFGFFLLIYKDGKLKL